MDKRLEFTLHSTYLGGTVNVWTRTRTLNGVNTYITDWSSSFDIRNEVHETYDMQEAIKNHDHVSRVAESAIVIATAEKHERVAVAIRRILSSQGG